MALGGLRDRTFCCSLVASDTHTDEKPGEHTPRVITNPARLHNRKKKKQKSDAHDPEASTFKWRELID